MDYKKEYEDALSRAAGFKTPELRDMAEYIFPVLREQEDERIRKELMNYFTDWKNGAQTSMFRGLHVEDILAWLANHGRQKGDKGNERETPISAWTEEDEENLQWFEKLFRAESVVVGGRDIPQERYLWFKHLKDRCVRSPRQEWTGEDEQILNEIISFIPYHLTAESYTLYVNWLRSRKPAGEEAATEELPISHSLTEEGVLTFADGSKAIIKKVGKV